jgi:phospholipid/cholesterol/gamma-HCH transport system substrate-binding protein
MKKFKYTNEFKVGLLVVCVLIVLAYMSYRTGEINFAEKGYNLFVVFDDVAGIQDNAQVMLNGVEVGRVEKIQLDNADAKTFITLTLWIKDAVKIRTDSAITIKTLGLMGEKYVAITASGAPTFLEPNAAIRGKKPLDIEYLMEQANKIVEDNKSSINKIIENLEMTSRNFEEFSDDIRRHPWKLLFKTKEKKGVAKDRDK